MKKSACASDENWAEAPVERGDAGRDPPRKEGYKLRLRLQALEELAKIRMDERDLHTKAGQNHAMAQQILSSDSLHTKAPFRVL